jgi:ATP-binding cassette, subfamily C (CFTR/MRP), member 1
LIIHIYLGKHIFDKVIGPNGLLHTKARLFVTHGIHFLSKTDSIIMMRDGRIIEQGHFDSLMKLKSELFNLITEFGQEEDNLTGEITDEPEEEVSSPTTLKTYEVDESRAVHRSEETTSQIRERRVSVVSLNRRPSLNIVKNSRKQDAEIGKDGLIAKEEMAKGRVALEVYIAYAKSCGIGNIIFYLIMLVISQAAQVGKYMILLK